MIVKGLTDVGIKRHSNQDTFAVITLPDSSVLAVVCDGMGGANSGNIASQKATEVITSFFERSYRKGLDAAGITALLQSAILSANIEIFDLASKKKELSGMGTTVVAAYVSNEFTVISHIGDSRAYLIDTEVTQLTRDHSVVQFLIENGKLTYEEARVHPRRNVITRALGIEAEVLVDSGEFKIKEGQSLLLCSDGLSNFITKEEIKDIFDNFDIQDVVKALVDKANNNGGGDNITVVTVTP
ncbi:MAG: Stp1/IreP family PP2C-type Ser/Thr phosphatase [Acutalibacteraceae bacterium]|nr:Stp1/IreP family PP2C-type Ser/Thr phosphatase [Acutalibacteraceae bacterium]